MKIEGRYKIPVGDVRDNLRATVIHATHKGTHILRASFAGRTLRERFHKMPKNVHLLTIADDCSLLK